MSNIVSIFQITYKGETVKLELNDADVLGAQRGVEARKQRVTERVEEELGVEDIEFHELEIDPRSFVARPPQGRVYKCSRCRDACTACGKSWNGRLT